MTFHAAVSASFLKILQAASEEENALRGAAAPADNGKCDAAAEPADDDMVRACKYVMLLACALQPSCIVSRRPHTLHPRPQ